MSERLCFIDTHTHFDVPAFDIDRHVAAQRAVDAQVKALVLIGYQYDFFARLLQTKQQAPASLAMLLAPGLHPCYVTQHQPAHLEALVQLLQRVPCVAVGEIGLDTFSSELKEPALYEKQKHFFSAQLDISQQMQKPVLLHVRRAHADTLTLLHAHQFKGGGIAHAFGGGIEEARQYLRLGFKLGITGLIQNPKAKRLRTVVQAVYQQYGASSFVLETDCPDMTPMGCRMAGHRHTRNEPANLPVVFAALCEALNISQEKEKYEFARQLWHNTTECLRLDWKYGYAAKYGVI